MSDWILHTEELCKSYGGTRALWDCSFSVRAGCVFGLLGPNGAGKSTLLRMLLGFIRPTSGSACIFDHDCCADSRKVREQVSYLPGDARLYRTLRGEQILRLFSGLQKFGSLEASRDVARKLELDLVRRVMFMSTGMRQKLALAVVLGSRAPLVILDEPTANLDPTVRGEVLEIVRGIRNQGRTVLMSSHLFSDIEDTCDEVAVLKNGSLVAREDLKQLKQLHVVCGESANSAQWLSLAQPEFVTYCRVEQSSVELHLRGQPSQWLSWLDNLNLTNLRIDRAGVRFIYERVHSASDRPRAEVVPATTPKVTRTGERLS